MKFKKGDLIKRRDGLTPAYLHTFVYLKRLKPHNVHNALTYKYEMRLKGESGEYSLFFWSLKELQESYTKATDKVIEEYLSFHIKSHIVNELRDDLKKTINSI